MNNRSIREALAETKVSSKQATKTEVKRLTTMLNNMKTILWGYIKTSYPHIYDATYAQGNKKIDAAIALLDDEKTNRPSWGEYFVSKLYGYKMYYRLDNIIHLESCRRAFKYDLIEFKRIKKAIKNYNDSEWTLDDIDAVMEELGCDTLVERVSARFRTMIAEYQWKYKNSALECMPLGEDEGPLLYVTEDGDEIEYETLGLMGYYSGSSTLATEIRKKIFEDTNIKLPTLALALENHMNNKVREAITRKIKDRLRHQEPLVEERAKTAKLHVVVAEKDGEIKRQAQACQAVEKERDMINAKFSARESVFAEQQGKLHQLTAENKVLKERDKVTQRRTYKG